MMHGLSKDLNLLMVFAALAAERNVTKAARRLSLSQPAMSHALARLRKSFGDDLFVRSGKGMTLTPRAQEMAAEVEAIVERVESLYAAGEAFDVRSAAGKIVMAATDYLEHMLLPAILPAMKRDAPGLTLVSRPTLGHLPKEALESGEIDFAIAGFFGDLPEGFFRRVVLSETYLCVVRKGHPLVKDALTLKAFLELDHVLVSPQGDLDGVADRVLAKQGKKRRVVVGVSNFHTPAALVAGSDAIATLPARIAEMHARTHGLRTFEPPVPLPGFKLTMVWHARTDRDGARRWVRGKAAEVLAGLD
jgi:DNA-binding transcriptional LysR family regulator